MADLAPYGEEDVQEADAILALQEEEAGLQAWRPVDFCHLRTEVLCAACSALGLPPRNSDKDGCAKLLSDAGISPEQAENAGQQLMAVRMAAKP